MHNILFLDAETYYDKEYSLRKMTPAQYILDPRWEFIICAAAVNDGPGFVVDGPDFPEFLRQYPPETTTTVTYNSLFDNCIFAWRYGYVPARMIDVLGMSRALLAHKLPRLGLEKVGEHLQLGSKTNALAKVIGMHRADIRANPTLWREYTEYAIRDVRLMRGIFDILLPGFPRSELRVMDLVLRAAVQPEFTIDVDMLTEHLAGVRADKESLLAACGAVERTDLMSADKFTQALENLGVEVEYKVSLATEKLIPAFAKTDEFMANLIDHDDPQVQALAAARLGIKSTIEETRAQRLLDVAACDWSALPSGNNLMPIPLRYGAAHTHRLGGDWKMNMQNMPTARGTGKSKLRKSLVAPGTKKVIVADLGQIEARLTAWLCGAHKLLGEFIRGEDPYKLLAVAIFGTPFEQITDLQRFFGKGGILGLGFGAAAPKFYIMMIRMARAQGLDIAALKKIWTKDLANKSVMTYHKVNWQIPQTWRLLDRCLSGAWCGLNAPMQVGPVEIGYRHGYGYVQGPNGLEMRYDNPRHEDGETWYDHSGRRHKIYGAKLLENIIQFLARIIVMHAALRIADRGYKFKLQSHDELVFIVDDKDVDNAEKIIHEEMVRRPSWAPDLPLTASIGHGQSYGDAK